MGQELSKPVVLRHLNTFNSSK